MKLFKVYMYFDGDWVQFGEVTTEHPQVQANAIQQALTGKLNGQIQIRLEQVTNPPEFYAPDPPVVTS